MDVIGKLYTDYIVKNQKLDGKSHRVVGKSFGGIFNILNHDSFNNKYLKHYLINYFLIVNQLHSRDKIICDSIKKENFIYSEELLPTALIFENGEDRTSYVINDPIIEIPIFSRTSKAACVFYGDKIRSDLLNQYSSLFIDTAGSDFNDIIESANYYPEHSIVSISDEYLDSTLKNILVDKHNFTLISHSPKMTYLFHNNDCIQIPNKFYIDNFSVINNVPVTGLGDKYFLLIALYRFYDNFTLIEAIEKSQRTISSII